MNFYLIEIIFIILLSINFAVIIKLWPFIRRRYAIKSYKSIQRIHEKEIPRFGGIIIFIFIFLYLMISNNEYFDQNRNFIFKLIISSFPIFFISSYEDITQSISPILRLIIMFFSASLSIFYLNINLPVVEIPFFGDFLSQSYFIFLFYIISIVIFVNGVNLIDGANGLMTVSSICQILGIFFLSYISGDIFLMNLLLVMLLPLIVFLFFNYPKGKIFIGDTGCYLYGFFISIFCIKLYGDNQHFPSWGAVLVLFFPLMEIFFSFFRKIFEKYSPFKPDDKHLHSLLYRKLLKNYKNKKIANNLVLPNLFIFWLSPLICILWFYNNSIGIFISLVILIILYLCLYKSLSSNCL